VRIGRLEPGDEALVDRAAALFDDPIDAETTRRFLAEEGHHLMIAFEGDTAVGFITGIELLHPDKPGPEMFVYELGVGEAFRRRGIGKALIESLTDLAHERGCYGMFVFTDDHNPAGNATYAAAGGTREPDQVMFSWDWRSPPGSAGEQLSR
jgi:ribosomal protein S18 acetylase RimI-like enzyme